MVDMVKLRTTLEEDEGRVDVIYLDHLGLPTFGIGHLITESDPEHKYSVGTAVTPERVFEVFEEDLKVIIREAEGEECLMSCRGIVYLELLIVVYLYHYLMTILKL